MDFEVKPISMTPADAVTEPIHGNPNFIFSY